MSPVGAAGGPQHESPTISGLGVQGGRLHRNLESAEEGSQAA